jgi:hypothetical protein
VHTTNGGPKSKEGVSVVESKNRMSYAPRRQRQSTGEGMQWNTEIENRVHIYYLGLGGKADASHSMYSYLFF